MAQSAQFGIQRNLTVAACGTKSRTNPSRFGSFVAVKRSIPVTFPPGWLRLTTRLRPAAGIKVSKKLSDELRRLIPALETVAVYVIFEQRTAEHRPFRIELRK